MGTTIKDVARLANVSVGTVSQVINNKGTAGEKSSKRVLDAIAKLKYRTNHYAKSLVTSKSSTIGLIVTDVTNPFFGMLIKYMQQEIELRNYSMLLGVSNDLIVQERRIVDFFMSRNIEGLIVVPANAEESRLDHLYALNQQEIPFVYCTGYYKGLSADCVMTDLQKGSYLLTRHLINSGHKKIILISGRPDAALSFLRVNGYKQAYQEAGIPYDSSWIKETNTDYQSGYAAAEQIIAQGLPDAIITINDMLAIGVLKCCKDKGIKVPGDVSVAGYDDLLFSAVAETPLTTVRQPIELICKKSVERIIDRIEKKNTPLDAVLLEPELILRESVRS